MDASKGLLLKSDSGENERIASLLEEHKPQEVWISDEEFYTEGSSDEDDMALRIKRRERREAKREKSTGGGAQVEAHGQDNLADDDHDEAGRQGQGAAQTAKPFKSLCEAYSSMHKLDALLRHSDQRLKDAQAETLRAQLSTRSHLRQLRDQAGSQNVVMARNWDAFMKLCPAMEPGVDDAPRDARDRDSVLPRISGADSDPESEDSDHSTSALAITDEEKLKLAALLRDLDQELAGDEDDDLAPGPDAVDPEGCYGSTAAAAAAGPRGGLGTGYNLDADARRSLENIDGKLQELVPEAASRRARRGLQSGAAGVATKAKAGTRQQRLEDIDRCLHALASSALEDVEPVGEEEVQALLQEARGWPGAHGASDGKTHEALLEPALIDGLLQEARRELPRFRYRHHQDGDDLVTNDQHLGSSRLEP